MATRNQYQMQDPRNQYPTPEFEEQPQPSPGLDSKMTPEPDHGEATYEGAGRLKGRKALVTGGDSGIGRATVIAYAREGASLVINYLPEEASDAQAVIDLVKAEGGEIVGIAGDLKDETFCQSLVQKAHQALGGLDIVVNVAGKQTARKNIAEVDTKQFDATLKTNLYALFWICKAALPLLPPGAAIINTASIQSYQPSATLLDYATTKAGIVGFTKALAKQAIEQGVRVNAVAPGPVWTVLQPSGGQPQEKIPHFGEQTPYKRPGQPAECAPLYVFLASQESSYITGEVFGVTGGNPLP